jgi:8-amino-7-oxononanoate synthase
MRSAREDGWLPYFRAAESAVDRTVVIEGRPRIMLGSANYLGLATHPEVISAAEQALRRFGPTTTGSRLLNGTTVLHEELEEQLADWLGVDAALVFTTGYQANLGAIAGLLGPGDTAIVDSGDHASLLDGCALAQAKVRAFRHNRLDLLDEALARAAAHDAGETLVIVDGLYSMHGDVAPLGEIAARTAHAGVALLVDEAHAIGVLGERGAGAAELFGVEADATVRMGALSKALGALGGFIAGSHDVIDELRIRARSFLFSTGAAPPALAAALAAVRIRRSPEGEERVARLQCNADALRQGLRALGFELPACGADAAGEPVATPIVAVVAGVEERAVEWWQRLFAEGVFASVAIHPAVPPAGALLRLCPTAAHTDDDVARTLAAFARLQRGR